MWLQTRTPAQKGGWKGEDRRGVFLKLCRKFMFEENSDRIKLFCLIPILACILLVTVIMRKKTIKSLESKTVTLMIWTWDIIVVEVLLGPTKREAFDIRNSCWQRLLTSKQKKNSSGISVGKTWICVIRTGWLCSGYFVAHTLESLRITWTLQCTSTLLLTKYVSSWSHSTSCPR